MTSDPTLATMINGAVVQTACLLDGSDLPRTGGSAAIPEPSVSHLNLLDQAREISCMFLVLLLYKRLSIFISLSLSLSLSLSSKIGSYFG